MTRCVSFFRGINVGGHHIIRMQELKALHESLGLQQVTTYLQSGNVVFSSSDAELAQLPERIAASITQKFGFSVDVLIRTSAEIDTLIALNPFQQQALQEPQWLTVLFLPTIPPTGALDKLQQLYNGPETWSLVDQELYIFYPNGIGRSKLTPALLDKTLQTKGTARNWNTVIHLQQMLQQL